jgi:hypothetical protein
VLEGKRKGMDVRRRKEERKVKKGKEGRKEERKARE